MAHVIIVCNEVKLVWLALALRGRFCWSEKNNTKRGVELCFHTIITLFENKFLF